LPRMAIPSPVPLAALLHLVEKLTGYDRGYRNSDPLIATARHNPRGPESIVGERISILPHLPPGVEVADSRIRLVLQYLLDRRRPREYRSREVMREFQREHPCPSTGRTTGACPGYRRDHIKPLCSGGPDAVWNLEWQTIRDARAKDRWERRACRH
jgi:hypothetical protein